MRQNSHTRLTQRGPRRRSHLGVLVCLMAAVLFTGILIGRLTDDPDPARHIFLDETAPPAAATANPAPTAQQKKAPQPNVERIPRGVTKRLPTDGPTTRSDKPPKDSIPGFTSEDQPRVLGRDDDGVRVMAGLASEVVSLTNAARTRRGCGTLRVDDGLSRSARTHSLEMARTGQLMHNSPDGGSPWDRMERAGYRWGAAENIGAGYSTPEEAVEGWLDSPDHRKNILDCRLKAIGVGVASGPGGPWWTQDFGTQ